MSVSLVFAYAPGDAVVITVHGFNVRGHVVSVSYNGAREMYQVEYMHEGEFKDRWFYAREIAAV